MFYDCASVLRDQLRDATLSETVPIGTRAKIESYRDGCAQVVLNQNRINCDVALQAEAGRQPDAPLNVFYFVAQDEVGLRLRSYKECVNGTELLSRSLYSKIQNMVATLHIGGHQLPVYLELVALERKDGPSIAKVLVDAFLEAAAFILMIVFCLGLFLLFTQTLGLYCSLFIRLLLGLFPLFFLLFLVFADGATRAQRRL